MLHLFYILLHTFYLVNVYCIIYLTVLPWWCFVFMCVTLYTIYILYWPCFMVTSLTMNRFIMRFSIVPPVLLLWLSALFKVKRQISVVKVGIYCHYITSWNTQLKKWNIQASCKAGNTVTVFFFSGNHSCKFFYRTYNRIFLQWSTSLLCRNECVRVKSLAMRDLYVKCVYSPKNRENSGHLANGTNLISDHLLADCRGATCHKRGGKQKESKKVRVWFLWWYMGTILLYIRLLKTLSCKFYELILSRKKW